ncbi:unnamed protein product, partial [Ectocarpus sp. 8 AP-2014]
MVTSPTPFSLSFSPSQAAEILLKYCPSMAGTRDSPTAVTSMAAAGVGATPCPFGTQIHELYPQPQEQETRRRLLPKQRPQLANGSTTAFRRKKQTEDVSDVGRTSTLDPVGHGVLCSRTHGYNRLPEERTRGTGNHHQRTPAGSQTPK